MCAYRYALKYLICISRVVLFVVKRAFSCEYFYLHLWGEGAEQSDSCQSYKEWKVCPITEIERRNALGHSAAIELMYFRALQLRLVPQVSPSAVMNSDMDALEVENQVELEEKTRLINQVLELQHTLEDLSARVDAVKEENLKLKSENQVLGQYIENLMSASSVFQTTDTKSKRK
uniref:Short coiled-coil protein n=2 Tax=Xenopus tropicalis TaxID=8364 RepID=A0A6I8SME0_XENTR